MGMEMLINALLKAAGYSKEDFETFVKRIIDEFNIFKKRAFDTEKRVNELGESNTAILQSLARIETHLAIEKPVESTDNGGTSTDLKG
jgi:hypothetical protein